MPEHPLDEEFFPNIQPEIPEGLQLFPRLTEIPKKGKEQRDERLQQGAVSSECRDPSGTRMGQGGDIPGVRNAGKTPREIPKMLLWDV